MSRQKLLPPKKAIAYSFLPSPIGDKYALRGLDCTPTPYTLATDPNDQHIKPVA